MQQKQLSKTVKILIYYGFFCSIQDYVVCFQSLILNSQPQHFISRKMCLAIPMCITSVDGINARCEARGALRDISLFMLQDDLPLIGDFVMVSNGQAVRRVSPEEARLSWEMWDLILAETPVI